MMKLPHLILETANFHGGDAKLLESAIETFSHLDYPSVGIKFHAFEPDRVALTDFSWYTTIKNLYIEADRWHRIIQTAASKKFRVWLDLFCTYGVNILETNLTYIHGIKLQPSVLDNREILEALQSLSLDRIELIINIAGLEVPSIKDYLKTVQNLNMCKVTLQSGFQDYPTDAGETSLGKIDTLRSEFPDLSLGYADHLDAGDPFARRFPVYAWLEGCSYLEKHVCLDRLETKYDADSALEFPEVVDLAAEIVRVGVSMSAPFITKKEKKYLGKTIQKPILKHTLYKGQLVGNRDILFRRTDRAGLNFAELKKLQENCFILNREKSQLDTLIRSDFKESRIAAVVAARMKSTRLKKKASLPINGVASIRRCLENCLKIPGIDEVILATSHQPEDAVLADYLPPGVRFWRGDADDVIGRYVRACDRYDIDVIIRITGDCPVVSPEIASFLLTAHFAAGADFTEPRAFAVGTNSQIYNTEALRRVIRLVGRAEYSEHMTYYMTNNPDIFKINIVDLPPKWIRDYRLTLDYPEDLDMLNELFNKLEEKKMEARLPAIFSILDEHPHIPRINAHKTLVYRTDRALIELLEEKTRIKPDEI